MSSHSLEPSLALRRHTVNTQKAYIDWHPFASVFRSWWHRSSKWRAPLRGFTQSFLSLCTGPWHPFSTVRSSAFPTVVGRDCRCSEFLGLGLWAFPRNLALRMLPTGPEKQAWTPLCPMQGETLGHEGMRQQWRSLHTAPHWSPQMNFFVEKNKLHHSEPGQGWPSAAAWCLEHANYQAVWAHLMDFSLPLIHNQHTNLSPAWWLPSGPETC